MTKEITKSFILQQMQDKFGLRELIPERFTFGEKVHPTYNIEQHLGKPEIIAIQHTITGTGAVEFYEVAFNERVHLDRYLYIPIGGVYTTAGVYITRGSDTMYIYLDLTAAQSTAYLINLPYPVILNPGDKLWVNIDGYTSEGSCRLRIDCIKEEIR